MFSFSKIILPIALLASPVLNATVYFPQGITIAHVRNASLEIAWDIHKVLAAKDGGAKAGAIIGGIFPIIFTKLSGNKAWDEVDQLGKQEKDVSGEAYVRIFNRHDESSLAKMAEKAANAYKPRKGIEALVQDIDNAGITQRLASNIGPICLHNLDMKFKNDYKCLLFDKMQPGLLINYEMYGPYNKSISKCIHQLTKHNKPHPEFFAEYNQWFNPDKRKTIIFIDDKLENIQAAVAAGWIGIHLDENKKDPVAAVRSELASLGVFNKKTVSTPLNNGLKYV